MFFFVSKLKIPKFFRARASARGMTLIELLAVMVIAVILISISVPALISISRGYGLKHSVSAVYNQLALARQWAITHKEDVTFKYFNQTSNSIFVVGVDRDSVFVPIATPVTNEPGIMFGSSSSVTFRSHGGLPDIQKGEIKITDGNASRKITINGLTGGVKVSE